MYVHVISLQRTCDVYVPVTALKTVEASRPAYRRTISLLLVYDRPAIGVRLACYRHRIGFWRMVLIIVYSRVNYIIENKRGGAVMIQ